MWVANLVVFLQTFNAALSLVPLLSVLQMHLPTHCFYPGLRFHVICCEIDHWKPLLWSEPDFNCYNVSCHFTTINLLLHSDSALMFLLSVCLGIFQSLQRSCIWCIEISRTLTWTLQLGPFCCSAKIFMCTQDLLHHIPHSVAAGAPFLWGEGAANKTLPPPHVAWSVGQSPHPRRLLVRPLLTPMQY